MRPPPAGGGRHCTGRVICRPMAIDTADAGGSCERDGAAPQPVMTRAYSIPETDTFALHDRDGHEFRIMVALPAGPNASPDSACPAIYLLDANACFATMTETLRMRSHRTPLSGVAPSLVVGIGYPTREPHDFVRRCYDYTPPAKRLTLPQRPDGEAWPRMGGADEFLDFIQHTLKPAIAQRYRLRHTREAIFGHSFGGLLVLHALFTRASLFDVHVATSPSIWWNERFILREEDAFVRRGESGGPRKHLLVMAGSEEYGGGPQFGMSRPAAEHTGPAEPAALAARLKSAPGLSVSYREFAGEDHGSVLPCAISHAVSYACRIA